MQPVLEGRHQAVEQGGVEAVQILQRVRHSEAGTQIEVKLGMPYWRKIHENHVAVGLLQSQGGIDRGGRGAGTPFGAQKCEDARFARAPACPGAVGTETSQSFEQSLRSGALIKIL